MTETEAASFTYIPSTTFQLLNQQTELCIYLN